LFNLSQFMLLKIKLCTLQYNCWTSSLKKPRLAKRIMAFIGVTDDFRYFGSTWLDIFGYIGWIQAECGNAVRYVDGLSNDIGALSEPIGLRPFSWAPVSMRSPSVLYPCLSSSLYFSTQKMEETPSSEASLNIYQSIWCPDIVFRSPQNRFLPNPFQFTIHSLFYQLMLYNIDVNTDSVVKYATKIHT
jgi:hypothetical protein